MIEGKPRKEQMFKLLIVIETKKKRFAEVSDPENKKLVDNSVQGNTQKSTKKGRNDLRALTLRNTKIVPYISQLPLKFRLSSNCSFFEKSYSLGIIL